LNALSRTIENHVADVALYFTSYDFGRAHQTLRRGPAPSAQRPAPSACRVAPGARHQAGSRPLLVGVGGRAREAGILVLGVAVALILRGLVRVLVLVRDHIAVILKLDVRVPTVRM
jgi:hypothetical protein